MVTFCIFYDQNQKFSELNLCAWSKLEEVLQKVVKVLSEKRQEYFKI